MARSDQPRQTAVDYVALALTPGLIMVLISSLIFFLLEIFYQGKYPERLQWTLFFFIFGAVLIARMSMTEEIASKASLYGLCLGIPVWIGMQQFVNYPEGSVVASLRGLINLGLIGIVWWCAHKLTHDCTNIDDQSEMSGEGLLQVAGLDLDASEDKPEEFEEPEPEVEGTKKKKPQADDFWSRYRKYADRRRKKHTLGVWVVYFSLAALPLFGLGQAFIPADAVARRRYTFWLLTFYVSSGLGLLLTTCFLSLRRYLRQKKLEMPAAMTGTWLTVGGILIALMVLMGALLPRPWSEYPLFQFRSSDSEDKNKSSRHAMKGDSPAKDEGPGSKDKGDPSEKAPGGAEKDKRDSQGKDKAGKGDKDGKDGSNQKDKKDGKSGDKDNSKSGESKAKSDKPKDSEQKSDEKDRNERQDSRNQTPSTPPWAALDWLRPFFKWLVFLILALVVLFLMFRSGLSWLSNFSDWAKRLLDAWNNFWANLFGWGKKEAANEEDEEEETYSTAGRSFLEFCDPFQSGGANRWSARELTRYSFAALEAWARERELARNEGETPYEFCERVGREIPNIAQDGRRLALLFARAAYAPGTMPPNTAETLRPLWEKMTSPSRI